MTILEEFFSIIEGKKETTEDKKTKKVKKVDKKKKPKSVSESTMDKANYLLDENFGQQRDYDDEDARW